MKNPGNDPRRRRDGFSLVEIMVAMTLLSVVLLSLARMSMTISLRSRVNDIVAKRNAVVTQEANKFGSMPYDSIAKISTATVTRLAGDFSYQRQLTVTATSTKSKSIKIVIIPTLSTYAKYKDSVTVHRSKQIGSALCGGC